MDEFEPMVTEEQARADYENAKAAVLLAEGLASSWRSIADCCIADLRSESHSHARADAEHLVNGARLLVNLARNALGVARTDLDWYVKRPDGTTATSDSGKGD